jgi:hypothetical protein
MLRQREEKTRSRGEAKLMLRRKRHKRRTLAYRLTRIEKRHGSAEKKICEG